MAGDINRVFLIGRLTRDPEMSVLAKSNTSVTKFSLANNRVFVTGGEKRDQTSFFNCIAWGKPGEVIAQHCKKGQRIGIEGRLQQRSWQDQNGQKRNTVEIVVENFQFLSGGPGQQGGESQSFGSDEAPVPSAQYYAPADADSGPQHFSDEDIPF